jgi:nicotinamide-nucleotide amidase
MADNNDFNTQSIQVSKELFVDDPIESQVGRALRERGWTLAVAESCTGGLVGHRITEVPGSSDYFMGGIIAYAYKAKEKFLGVDHATLEIHGAVSEETAMQMAEGVRKAFNVDIGISVTGIAGPTSDLTEKPVGLTWIAVSTRGGVFAESHRWKGDRSSNKVQSAEAALQLASKIIKETPMIESIPVEARLDPDGSLRPIAFEWRGQRYQIESLGRQWQEVDSHHFLVMTAGDRVFELAYLSGENQWQLRRSPEDFNRKKSV